MTFAWYSINCSTYNITHGKDCDVNRNKNASLSKKRDVPTLKRLFDKKNFTKCRIRKKVGFELS
jgi:hypothetical protein